MTMGTNHGSATKAAKKEKPRRLSDLDVREVSLVDRPAIDRKFLVTKRHEGATGETVMTLSSAQRAILTKSDSIIRSIAEERFGLVTKTLDEIKSGISNMSVSEVREKMSAVFSNLYSVESDLTALTKSMQDDGILPADFDIKAAKGLADDSEKKKAEEEEEEEAPPAEGAGSEGGSEGGAKPDEEEEEKKKSVPADLLTAIDATVPLLTKAAENAGTSPEAATALKRVTAFLGKVKATGEVAKGLDAANVDKGIASMTAEKVENLKAAHAAIGNVLSIFTTGKAAPAEDDPEKRETSTKRASGTDEAIVKSLNAISQQLGTFTDRLETLERTRTIAKGAGSENTDGKGGKSNVEKGAIDWSNVL